MHKKRHHHQKQEEIETLTEQLTESRAQFQHLNHDATSLADRYSRLEKSRTDSGEEPFSGNSGGAAELRAVKEKMQNEHATRSRKLALQQERERLLQKNEHAKAKVEAIIQAFSHFRHSAGSSRAGNPAVRPPNRSE